jgi:hypothetical protein
LELLRWLVLFALAGALMFGLTTGIAGANELADEPATLSSEITDKASPMDVAEDDYSLADADISMQVWRAIDAPDGAGRSGP